MFRSFLTPFICEPILRLSSFTLYQTVRHIRKPRKPFWLGTAKSKRFIIHDEPILPPEERAELLRLHANYKTSIKSIRQYLASVESKDGASIGTTTFRASSKEIEASFEANDEWNMECERRRQDRLSRNSLDHQQLAEKVIHEVNEKELEFQNRVEELVLKEKEKSKDFITKENLDKKIEACLATEIDYNYAIDLQGSMFTGYEANMKPSPLDLSSNARRIETDEKPQ